MRDKSIAAAAAASAAAGAVLVLLVAWGAGWLHGERHTVVVEEAAPPIQVSVPARVRGLVGPSFDPAAIFRSRSPGVVTIYSVYDSTGSVAQGSGFVASGDGVILTNSHVITTAGDG
ncbi:MAG TPA: hypothetical protein VFA24_07305, partial [Gaiellaceae bacterium]|nr:hypothetical protein [Gaiellaceae bacterium]